MNFVLPAGLPDSLLLQRLAAKTAELSHAPSRKPPYLEWLKSLRDLVAPELSYINIHFPEYTPHDEANHIHPLFKLADSLLGSELLDNLNATELFVLACSIYAHDWGMAVAEAEMQCILGFAAIQPGQSFELLEDEPLQFRKELSKRGIIEIATSAAEIPTVVIQNYIRSTHASRSGKRIMKFFKDRDAHLGYAIALVSEGHNFDVEKLREFDASTMIQSESISVRALAIYLRLVDLLDISQDRTPYALWKFVHPEDPISSKEWLKHRAISSIGFEPHVDSTRLLRVSGSTSDHQIYAALEDLEDYCRNQFALTNGLLAELAPRYHHRIVEIVWKIRAEGFSPISIRFEFDRHAMVKLLGDEIYQGDRYVFIRELLQNSIDAIRLRRELHRVKKTGIVFPAAIHIDVEHNSESNSSMVRVSDNGAGMNEFVVKNYFSVAGKSYYKSDEFKKLGVSMDPVSRFGVGVLTSMFHNTSNHWPSNPCCMGNGQHFGLISNSHLW